MYKFRKTLALFMAAVITLSVSACGIIKDGANEKTGTGADTQTDADAGADNADMGNAYTDNTYADNTDIGNTDSGNTNSGSAAQFTGTGYLDVNVGTDYMDLKASIRFFHCKTDSEENGRMAMLIAEFNKLYPNITIETEASPTFADDALFRLLQGDWGDIIMIPAIDKKELSRYFMPVGTVDDLDRRLYFMKDAQVYDGIAYGIPIWGNVSGVVYNKKIFREAGVTDIPSTPDGFITALKAIKDKTNAVPLYINDLDGQFAASWDSYLGITTDGDGAYMSHKFVHTANPFKDKGNGSGAYALYKILYDAAAAGLTGKSFAEADPEDCRDMINRGEIGAIVLDSKTYLQMADKDGFGDDIGYMPFPMTVGGTQYVPAVGDYDLGININSSDDNKIASLIFIKWLIEDSGWSYEEGRYSSVRGVKNPEIYSAFENCVLLSDEPAPADEEDSLNMMSIESGLLFNTWGSDKTKRIVEAAFTGSETFDDIMADWTKAWNDAQAELGILVDK